MTDDAKDTDALRRLVREDAAINAAVVEALRNPTPTPTPEPREEPTA